MQQISDKGFILKLLQAYKGCRKIYEDNASYYRYKSEHIARYMSRPAVYDSQKNHQSIYEVWEFRLREHDIEQLVLTMPNTFDENPFTAPQEVIKEMIELIDSVYR